MLTLLLCVAVAPAALAVPITVTTSAGQVQGSVDGDGVSSFRGIPYAEPPVLARRWQDPVPRVPWTGVKSTTVDGAGCPQECKLRTICCPPTQDEDCLFLNVFSPPGAASSSASSNNNSTTTKKAVLFCESSFLYARCTMAVRSVTAASYVHPLVPRTRRHNTKPQCLLPACSSLCFASAFCSCFAPIRSRPSIRARFTLHHHHSLTPSCFRSPVVFLLPAPSPSLYPTTQPPKHPNTHPRNDTGIHGGNFYQGYGGGLLYDGTTIAREQDVVVVALNYRLGALGFLYSGPDKATQFTGNFGLRDQQLALRWVQENAAAFGGDPSRVTIFGQSAGGCR